MSKVSEHLHAFHKAMHQDCSDAILNHQTALEKAGAMEPAGGTHTTFLKAEIARYQKKLAHHADGMAECAKAIEASNLHKNETEPTRVSGVAPENPRLRAVPRFGSKPMAEAAAAVGPEMSKMLGLSAEDQHSEELSLQK